MADKLKSLLISLYEREKLRENPPYSPFVKGGKKGDLERKDVKI